MQAYYWQVTARHRYTDPIQYISINGKPSYQYLATNSPVFRAFTAPVVVAYTAEEAARRFREEHIPPGCVHTDILTVQRLGPYDFRAHKEASSAAREAAV